MGTVDIGQRFHIIAYMIATNEGKQDWDTAIADVKAEVTAVVEKYARNRWRV
jgi:hypothetical protein